MATNSTHSKIKTTADGGRDYSTIQSWEDDIGVGLGTSTNLVTDDYDHYGWIHSEEFVENVTIGGHTTDSTHKIYLAADSNGGTVTAAGHSHTKTDAALMDADRALVYNTSYASMKRSGAYNTGLTVSDDYADISRIQFSQPNGNGYGFAYSGSGNLKVERCLFNCVVRPGAYYDFSADNKSLECYACLWVLTGDQSTAIAYWHPSNTTGRFYNCTVVNDSGSGLSSTSKQVRINYSRPIIKNCALFGGGEGTEYFISGGGTAWPTGNLDYNATDFSDFSSKSGEGSNNVYSLTMSNQFTALDNTDWRLKTGNNLNTGGTDLTGTVPKDIFGNDFNVGDIGCQASAAAVASTFRGLTLLGVGS